jgi:spore coat protein U-like protein
MRLVAPSLKYFVVIAALSLAAKPVLATVTTSNLNVKIQITSLCLAGATTAVDFGPHGLLNTNIDQAGSVSVTCTTGTTYAVGLSLGGGTGADIVNRLMTGPAGATVLYHLYSDSSRTLNWDDTGGTNVPGGTGNGTLQTIPVYGRVPSQTTPAVGNYADIVQVTFTY